MLFSLKGAPIIIKRIDEDNCLDVFMYAKLHKYEDVEKAAFEAIFTHVKFILEGTRLKTLIKDHPEEVANLMVNINKNMQQKLNFLQHPISMHGGGGGVYDLPSGLKRDISLFRTLGYRS